jgi:glycosyltransferase involved in cell wall biosynthesis
MKILLVVHLFLPDYFSGTEILTLHTALELKSRGHEVQVFTGFPATVALSDAERFDRYVHEGIPVTRFKHAHAAMGDQSNVAEQEYDNHLAAQQFTALLDEFQPDLVHFFHLMRTSASVVDICRARGLPTVLTPTDFWFVCPTSQLRLPDGSMCPGPDAIGANCVRHLASLKMRGFAASALNHLPAPLLSGVVRLAARTPLRWVKPANLVAALSQRQAFLKDRLNHINKVLVPTRSMQQVLHQNGLDPAHVRFCSYGIRFPQQPARAPRAQGPLRLGVIGIGEHKGAHVVIEAMRKLPDAALSLKIYGRPSDFPDYARQLEGLAAADPRVQLCGSFPNDQIGLVLSQLDILLVPSLWFENAPLVIYSAQAAGVPVVASDVTGVAELITDGDNGRLFPPGDVDRLAEIIAALAQDRSQIDRYSERARMPKTIAAYTDELLAVYGELGADVGQPA